MSNSQMKRGTVLLVEDDPAIVIVVERELRDLGFDPATVHSGEDAIAQHRNNPGAFVLAIFDLTLPGIGGLEVCREVRKSDKHLPILMLTSRSSEVDKVLGFEVGADDYLTKPFGVAEFRARVQALVRRAKLADAPSDLPKVLQFERLSIDLERRMITRDAEVLEFSPIEFELLVLLATHPEKPITKQQLLNVIWGYDNLVYENNLTPHISRLRKKLEPDPMNPMFIKTVWGVGYCFIGKPVQK